MARAETEDVAEPLHGRPPTEETDPIAEVGAGNRTEGSENDHQPDVQVAGGRIRGNCQQRRFTRERDAGTLDQNAQAGGRIADRVSEGADVDVQRGPYTGRFMAEYDAEVSDDPLYILRHSTAHVLAAAVTQLFPGTKYAGGPPVENGFYYDFDLSRPLSEDDLQPIEKKMREIIARGDPFEQKLLSQAEALRIFTELDQPYKLYWINQKASADELVSSYRTGDFLDLCRGPHVATTADIPAFKLMRVAGAYWLGDERYPQLSRVYGTAWFSPEELDEYLRALEEAEKRDHKRLGRDLKIFALDERTGAGQVLWLPNGATIRRELERWIVDEELARGYQHVVTPVVAKLDLYRQSGHWDRYHDSMYPVMRADSVEDRRDRQQLSLGEVGRADGHDPGPLVRAERRSHLLRSRPARRGDPERDRAGALLHGDAECHRLPVPAL